jgi:hypothetical protein
MTLRPACLANIAKSDLQVKIAQAAKRGKGDGWRGYDIFLKNSSVAFWSGTRVSLERGFEVNC